jgi:hypothetical protein
MCGGSQRAGRFVDVAGQSYKVARPPEGMVTIVDHRGRAVVVSLDFILDSDQPVAVILDYLKDQPEAMVI